MAYPPGPVEICNIALARIGHTQTITSLTDTSSNAAIQCNFFYDHARRDTLRAYRWTFAKRYDVLAQVSTTGTMANAEWIYSYRYPTDALNVYRLVPTPTPTSGQTNVSVSDGSYPQVWLRQDGDGSPAPFELSSDSQGKLILTDLANATAVYIVDHTETEQWPADFACAVEWRLASELAYGLGISNDRREYARKMYEREIYAAAAHDRNEGQNGQPWIRYNAEAIRARFGG